MNPYQTIFEDQQKHFLKEIKNSTAKERIAKLKKLRSWIFSHRQEIRNAVYKDFKKPAVGVDLSEIKVVLNEIDVATGNLKKWMKPKKVPTPITFLGTKSWIEYEAKGVALILAPWNFPFQLTIGPLVSAIAAGNCAVVKPSEMSEHTSDLMKSMISDLFDESEVTVVLGDYKVSESLLKLPFDHIFFTGSPQVGKIVMNAAAKNLTSVTLELGGQNPVVVDETARIKDAAKRLIYGKFMNNGQSCVSVNTVYVHKSKQDELVTELKSELSKAFPGDAFKNEDYARTINEKHFQRVKNLSVDAVEKGAEIITGSTFDEEDCYIAPTILNNVPREANICNEEIFGPVMPIQSYENIEDVVSEINNKEKPLALYVFSQTKKNINYILKNTSSGTTAINETTWQFGQKHLPFGGVNSSGMGKSHGHHGFMAFTNERSMLKQKNGFTIAQLVHPPYTKSVKWIVDLIVKYL
ncbi:MAG: aldehyde dehydrogenase family protein [Calditrichaeota bacterium]|nr:MAG: aldehyde dehydrogenase family protein [Calditrichota bacterium]MBL1205332.1 aldehyde dehydrogenase family protein [Calditrichota bacterium]NOG45161.1 aldehyde dehydrogenase family protein [Calditrichota bacterium]